MATPSQDFLDGVRVADLSGLAAGEHTVRVELLAADGSVLASRDTLLRLDGSYAVTVLLTASCASIACPRPDGPIEHTACHGGRCVDPRCSPERPELCGEETCATAADCGGAECSTGVCEDGECFLRPRDEECDPGFVCDVVEGCVLALGVDGGPACPATETACTDGRDDDCDGLVDCADPDCADSSCDDASVCTDGDRCTDGECSGTPISCDDGNECTDDSCDPVAGCQSTPNAAQCDDGVWCNGADACRDGLCQDHTDPPCTEFCNETAMRCDMCATAADCGAVTQGDWGPCGGFANPCDQTGTQSRTVMTPRCTDGSCSVDTTSESRSCSRTVVNGTGCGTNRVCCSGSCVDIRSDAHCGACQVSCSAIGLTCAATGTGGYGCRGCTTNAMCQSEHDSAATCYNVGAPPAFCQCQCPSNGVCSGGGCGSNFYCHDESGHNYCSPNP